MAEIAVRYHGPIVDLSFKGHIAVVDWEGNLLYSVGDPDRVTFARSSAKPIQAIAAVESGALEAYGVTEKELALMCSSHNGESFHCEAVESVLGKAGLDISYLRCGEKWPMYGPARDELVKKGEGMARIYCDCSGKHSGMLLGAKYLGEELETYYLPEHPVQKRITKVISEVCRIPEEEIVMGCDGCGVPVHAMPLRKFAEGFARMSKPECLGKHEAAARRITAAMTKYPEMVAGTGRLCTELMQAFPDRVFGKSGAASYYAMGLLGKGIGITVKLEDGTNVVPYAVLETLVQLGVITREEADSVPLYADKNFYNTKHQVVGYTKATFELKKHF